MTELQELLVAGIDAARNKRNKMLYVIVNRYNQHDLHVNIMKMDIPKLNVSILLSQQLRLIPPERRPIEVGKLLRGYIFAETNEVLLLSHIEYLFDRELKQNPVRLFESLSGNKILIIQWPGTYERGTLKYATPEHHEYYEGNISNTGYVTEI